MFGMNATECFKQHWKACPLSFQLSRGGGDEELQFGFRAAEKPNQWVWPLTSWDRKLQFESAGDKQEICQFQHGHEPSRSSGILELEQV